MKSSRETLKVRMPPQTCLRRKEILAIGGGGVITGYDFRKAVEDGRLPRHPWPGRTYAKYLRCEVIEAFGLEPEN
jgi:hypothetical protein